MHTTGKVVPLPSERQEADIILGSGVVGQIVETVAPPEDVNPNTPLFGPIFGATFGAFSVSETSVFQHQALGRNHEMNFC